MHLCLGRRDRALFLFAGSRRAVASEYHTGPAQPSLLRCEHTAGATSRRSTAKSFLLARGVSTLETRWAHRQNRSEPSRTCARRNELFWPCAEELAVGVCTVHLGHRFYESLMGEHPISECRRKSS